MEPKGHWMIATVLTAVLAVPASGTLTLPVTHDLRADYDASAQPGLSDGDRVTDLIDSAGGDDNGTASGYHAYTGVHYAAGAAPSGLPGLRFDSYSGQDIGDWFNIPSMTPRHVFFVAKETRPGRTSTIMGQTGAYEWHTGGSTNIFSPGWAPKAAYWTLKLDGAPNDNTRFALNANFNLSIAIDADHTAYTNRLCSDRDGYGYRTWGGDIYEVLIYTAPLTAEEENAVGFYLQTKWGLTGAYTGAAGPHLGDANRDRMVDLQDFGLLKMNYGATSGATWEMGDFNGDGNIDLQDFGLLKVHYGHSGDADSVPVTAVPEPACLLLLGAAAGLVRRRRGA